MTRPFALLSLLVLASPLAVAAPKAPPTPAIVDLAPAGEQCALRADHSLWCWGERRNAVNGVVSRPTTEAVKVLDDVKRFAVGGFRGVAIRSDGIPVLWRWKLEDGGAIRGLNIEANKLVTDAVDVAVVSSEQAVVVRADGTAVTWNPPSQLSGPSFASKPINDLTNAKRIACGGVSCCALLATGEVACFEPGEGTARKAVGVKGVQEVLVGETQAIARTGKGPVVLDLVPGRAPKEQRSRLGFSKYFRGACGLDKKSYLSCPWMLGEELETMVGLGRGLKVAGVGGGTACAVNAKGKLQCRRYAGAARGRLDPVVDITFRTEPLPQ